MSTERITITRSQIQDIDTLCAGIVTRDGEMDACCKAATTIIYDAEHASVWPACTWHAHRYGGALTLAQIREALTQGATRFEREVAPW
ncbi:hypothetical protein [Nocardioides soli]|uniref:Uncharacterized protein n=1 Tax=Nocardioides soli TaxID=1036020 RepID=A0A7W4VSI9_9ACTN|nr:hypothetical protein [Nocardioides soli]MBB3040986.1 hypothetical protein [Nocardioides soli]